MASLSAVRDVLAVHRHRRIPLEGAMRQAAVAAVLREDAVHGPELLLIRRAEHPDDPWSGHMAFPGGRVDPGDDSAFDAAIREACEEVSLDLRHHARKIGSLSHMTAMAHGKPLPMVVIPFVFELTNSIPPLRLNEEVQEVVWMPLSFLLDPTNRSSMRRKYFGVTWTLPCYRFEGRVLWGLTLRIVDELLELVR